LDSNSSFSNSLYSATTTTTLQNALLTSTEYSSEKMQLHESGAFSSGGFALSSVTYDQTERDHTRSTQNSNSTRVVDPTTARTGSSVSMMQTTAGTANVQSVSTITDSVVPSLESRAWSSLHQVGTTSTANAT